MSCLLLPLEQDAIHDGQLPTLNSPMHSFKSSYLSSQVVKQVELGYRLTPPQVQIVHVVYRTLTGIHQDLKLNKIM